MDTRFWGPSAWILLHTIAYNYVPNEINRDTYTLFFESLKDVLPCIYCRASYIEYISIEPIQKYLDSARDLSIWLYKVHNLVNNKLREQGLIDWNDPSFEDIYKRYADQNLSMDKCHSRYQSIMAWNFLYCIAFVYAEYGIETSLTSYYNGYNIFFNKLGDVLPDKGGYRNIYNKYLKQNPIVKSLKNRELLKKWIYNLEKYVNNIFRLNCDDFTKIEDDIEQYRAGCGGKQKDLKPTCRRINK